MEGIAPGAEVMIVTDKFKEPTSVVEVFRDGFTAKLGHPHEAGELIQVVLQSERCRNDGKTVLMGPSVENGDHRTHQVTPKCMAGIKPGVTVVIGSGRDEETKEVISAGVDSFTVSLAHAHRAQDPILVGTVPCQAGARLETSRGLITVGCPKVWRSDRIFTVLDGILRDVDSITLKALQDLDPNESNMAEIISILNDTEIAAKFDQAGLVNNTLKAQQIKANRGAELQNLNAAQKRNQQLLKAKDERVQKLIQLQREADKLTSQDLKDNQAKQAAVIAEIDDLNKQLQVQTISDQSVTNTGVDVPKTSGATFAIPDDLKKAFQSSLKAPTLPAAVRMDNVIELLHQRLSREFMVMYDDLTRMSNTYDIYLMQFDIGLVPKGNAKDREAQVKLKFTDPGILAYELYPSTSSYNIMRGMDKTNRFGISGAAQTLFGFGMSAAFSHERNELRSGMSQSLFVSGFGAGTNDFGWLVGPSPVDNLINPGNRIVHALILVPKIEGIGRSALDFSVSYCWLKRENRYQWLFTGHGKDCGENDDGPATLTINMGLPATSHLIVDQVSYDPLELKETPGSSGVVNTADSNTVLVHFKETVDPNLTITAGNQLIRRVRDLRGRALFNGGEEKLAGNINEQNALSKSRFGLLESDLLDPDTWLQLNSHAVLLNISKTAAGTDVFPVITLADPGAKGGELATLFSSNAKVRIGEWLFSAKEKPEDRDLPESAFAPLFTLTYGAGRIKVHVDNIENGRPSLLRINSETHVAGRNDMVWLHEHAQVVLVAKSGTPKNKDSQSAWALNCDGEQGSLLCKVPLEDINDNYSVFPVAFKVWVDEPPYFGRPGLWADDDIFPELNASWKREPYPIGDWTGVREIAGTCGEGHWCNWAATIKLKNLVEVKANEHRCVPELEPGKLKSDLLEVLKHSLQSHDIFDTTGYKSDNQTKQRAASRRKQFVFQTKDLPLVMKPRFSESGASTTLSLTVPFVYLPVLTQQLTVAVCDSTGQISNPVSLPDLYPKFLPGTVIKTHVGSGSFVLQGNHLQAVDTIRLEGGGQVAIVNANPGFNTTTFFIGKLDPGDYVVSAIIGLMTVPLEEAGADNKPKPLTINIPDPNAKKAANDDPAKEKARVDVDMDLRLKTDASADKGNGATRKSGGSSSTKAKQGGKKNTDNSTTPPPAIGGAPK